MPAATQTPSPSVGSPNGSKSSELASIASTASTASTLVDEDLAFSAAAADPTQATQATKRSKTRQHRNKKQKKELESTEKQTAELSKESLSKGLTEADAELDVETNAEPSLKNKFTPDLQELIDTLKLTTTAETNEKSGSTTTTTTPPVDAVSEFLSKRLRNLQKRKARIDKIAEISETQKLNADQQAALDNREYVEGVLKELSEVLEVNKQQQAKVKADAAAKEAALAESVKEVLVQAKEVGVALGEEKIRILIKFLRAASYKRQAAAQSLSVTPQSAGFEALLLSVYNGDESSVSAVTCLYEGSEKLVAEDTVSYKVIRDVSRLPVEVLLAGGDVVANEEDEITEEEAESVEDDVAESGSGKTAAEENSQGSVKISFLQESELDEDAAAAAASATVVKADTVAEDQVATESPVVNSEVTTAPVTAVTATTESTTPVSTSVSSDVAASTPATEKPAQRKKKPYYHRRGRTSNGGSSSNTSNNNNNSKPKISA